MNVLIGTEEIVPNMPYPVVAIGNFDGLHLGHRAILRKTVERAKEKNGTAMVLTFKPHPSQILSPKQPTRLLSPFDEKIELIASCGIEMLLLVEFSREFAHQTPTQFAQGLLAEAVGCKEVIVGEGFAFGKNRSGHVADLIQLGKTFGFTVITQETVLLQGVPVSSSKIRTLLQEGNVQLVSKMLSRPYTLEGEVVHGDGAGKKFGFPTANIRLPGRLVPKEGIYATHTILPDQTPPQDSIVYIGAKPTFQEQGETQIEVHLFDYNKSLYGKKISVAFLEWIRPDKTFKDQFALIQQMKQDARAARAILGRAHSG